MIGDNIKHDPYVAFVAFSNQSSKIVCRPKVLIHSVQVLEPVSMVAAAIFTNHPKCSTEDKSTHMSVRRPCMDNTVGSRRLTEDELNLHDQQLHIRNTSQKRTTNEIHTTR